MQVLEYKLTDTEREILKLVKQGFDNTEISKKSCFSFRYIENIIQNLYQKFEIDHNNQKIKRVLLVLKAIDLKQ
jgi:DNA-binding NarL/FixJ family response regulator